MPRWPFRRALRPGPPEDEGHAIRAELDLHVDLLTEELVQQGMDPEVARERALARFGNREGVERALRRRAKHRRTRDTGRETMKGWFEDARYAWRFVRRNPGFAAAVALTLSLAAGGNAVIFGVLDAALFRSLPFADADELVFVDGTHETQGEVAVRYASVPEFRDWRERAGTIDPMVAVDVNSVALSEDGPAEQVTAEFVSEGYFALLGGSPALGRTFAGAEFETPDGYPLAVLSDGLWQRRYGADPEVLGRTTRVNGRAVTVVGVMSPQFRGVSSADVEMWFPLGMLSLVGSVGTLDSRGTRFLPVVGRLAPGADRSSAQAEMTSITRALEAEYPDLNQDRRARVQSFREGYLGSMERAVWMLFAAGLLLLVLASANVANLLLVRTHARTRELLVRRALGAANARVGRQSVTESVVLAALGGLIGVGVAVFGMRGLAAMIPPGLFPEFATPRLSPLALAASGAVVALAGLAAGTVPAWRGVRTDVSGGLRASSSRSVGSRHGAQRTFVVLQIAVALVLSVGAGLLTRSLRAQLAIDPGLDLAGLHVFRLQPPRERYPNGASIRTFVDEVQGAVASVPGVSSVSLSSDFPLRGRSSGAYLFRTDRPEERIRYHHHSVTPGFFDHLGVEMLRGRGLAESDDEAAPGVAVVTQALVDRVFPGEPDVVGRTLYLRDPSDPDNAAEIVGVIGNLTYRGLTLDPMEDANSPDVFVTLRQIPAPTLEVSFRATGSLEDVASSVRAAVATVDPSLPVFQLASLVDVYAEQTAMPRFLAFLMGVLATLALILACIGVYGVLAFTVAQREPEIALRRALGADGAEIARSVLLGALALTALGSVAGLALAAMGSRLVGAFLFGVRPADPITLATTTLVLAALCLAAAAPSAWRASRSDPAAALRGD